MNVEHIEPVIAADLSHLDGKRQRIIRVFEQAVIVDRHRMKPQPWLIGRHPKGAFVADEMDLVPAPGEFFPQGRRQDAAAPDRRVTRNADFKRARVH